jgi:hypothetical protein
MCSRGGVFAREVRYRHDDTLAKKEGRSPKIIRKKQPIPASLLMLTSCPLMRINRTSDARGFYIPNNFTLLSSQFEQVMSNSPAFGRVNLPFPRTHLSTVRRKKLLASLTEHAQPIEVSETLRLIPPLFDAILPKALQCPLRACLFNTCFDVRLKLTGARIMCASDKR